MEFQKEVSQPVEALPPHYRTSVPYDLDKRRKVKSDIETTLLGPDERYQGSKSDILVLKQQSYTGTSGVLPSATANIRCSKLGVDGMLKKLTDLIHLVDSDRDACEYFIAKNDDFGTAYAHLRCNFYTSDIDKQVTTARSFDEEIRREMLTSTSLTNNLPHRRVWDLYANRVVPSWVPHLSEHPWAISHAWVADNNLKCERTPINGYEWPVPMPKDADLNLIRIEMLRLGAEYVWLDVLCLRQGRRSEDPPFPISHEEWDRREALRKEEWEVDVPMIGWVYFNAPEVVCYFSGLGLPLSFKTHSDFQDDRCWFNRAWTLQEISDDMLTAGKTHDDETRDDDLIDERFMTTDTQKEFKDQLASLEEIQKWKKGNASIFHILSLMRKRKSTKALDTVFGLAYLMHAKQIPIYNSNLSVEHAWMDLMDVANEAIRAQVLFFYHKPGYGHTAWRPSWRQVMDSDEKLPEVQDWFTELENETCVPSSKEGRDWHNGPRIDACSVQGLDNASEHPRHGELIVKRNSEVEDTFRIVVDHAYPINDGQYTLLGANSYGRHNVLRKFWVVGKIEEHTRGFRKVSVFSMADDEEAKRLVSLNVHKETITVLL